MEQFSNSDKEKIKMGKDTLNSFFQELNVPLDNKSADTLSFIMEIITNKKYSKIWNKKN